MSRKKHFDESRRQFLKQTIKYGLAAIGGVLAAEILKELGKDIYSGSKKTFFSKDIPTLIREDKYLTKLIEKLFLGTGDNVAFLPASDNPYVGRKLTFGTIEAAEPFKAVVYDLDKRMKEISGTRQVGIVGNLISFGGPISNFISRVLMQYKEIKGDSKKYGLEIIHDGVFHFPITFELNAELLMTNPDNPFPVCNRQISDETIRMPNWGIKIMSNDYQSPSVTNGELISDYLLITNTPNIFSRKAYERGYRIVTFGGTHATGTRAVNLLLRDMKLLEEIYQRTSALDAWQVLLTVNNIDPTTSAPLSLLRSIMVERIDIDKNELEWQVEANSKIHM